MRRIMLMFISCFTIAGAFAHSQTMASDTSKLPKTAKEFIKKHFTRTNISHVKEEEGIWIWKTYEVILTDGSDIEFDHAGEWTEIDCERQAVPGEIIPSRIREHVNKNHPGQIIVSIKKESKGYEIQFLDGRELKYNRKGNFLRFD